MTKQALEGVKVIDLTWVLVGPTTSMYLADYGATVVHVESSIWMDILRQGPPFKDGVVGLNRSGWFNNYNRNKLGITLNLKHPQGVELFKKLAAWADVVVENFAAGVMNRMGIGYEHLAQVKPDIIMLSTCMQGQTGPHATHPGYGVQMASLAGISQFMGWPDREPSIIYGAYTDSIVPRFAAASIIAALDHRRRTGKGQHLDLSQYETSVAFVSPAILDYTVNRREGQRTGNRSDHAAPHGAYPCRGNDRWCALAVASDKEWLSFRRVMGNPEWSGDQRFATLQGRKQNEDELEALVSAWSVEHTPEEVMAALQCSGIPAGLVVSGEDLHSDVQLKHRQHFWMLDHPVAGTHAHDAPASRLSGTPAQARTPAPKLGEHTEYVCREFLGIGAGEFGKLSQDGVFE